MITDLDNNAIPSDTAKGDGAADRMPVEEYSAERIAESLLSNAVDELDYAWAVREVRKLGIDPEGVLHGRPTAALRPRGGRAQPEPTGTP